MTLTETDEREERHHRPAERVINALLGPDVLVTDELREKLIEIASRENVITAEIAAKILSRQEAVAAKDAPPLDGAKAVTVRDGVAIIEIAGPIMRRADMFAEISGGVSVESLAKDFTSAINDPSVDAILFRFDTGGGEAKGINEFANMIYDAVSAGKLVGGYIEVAGSAGYWIGSAVTPGLAWIDAIGFAGSIGVRATMSKQRQSNSVEAISDISPEKVINPESEAGKAALLKRANDMAEIFASTVSRNRGISRDQVVATRGRMLMGQAAVDAGLADKVGSFEGLLTEIKSQIAERKAAALNAAGAVASVEDNTGDVSASAEKGEDMSSFMEKLKALVNGPEADASAGSRALDVAPAAVAQASQAPMHLVSADGLNPLCGVAASDAQTLVGSTDNAEAVTCAPCLQVDRKQRANAEAAAKAEDERIRAASIDEAANAFVTTHCAAIGKDGTESFRALFVAAKTSGDENSIKHLETAAAAYPKEQTGRVDTSNVASAESLMKATTEKDVAPIAAANVKAAGIKPGTKAWSPAYGAEVKRLRAEMVATSGA